MIDAVMNLVLVAPFACHVGGRTMYLLPSSDRRKISASLKHHPPHFHHLNSSSCSHPFRPPIFSLEERVFDFYTMPKKDQLQSLPPEPIDERSPLLPNQNGQHPGRLPAENDPTGLEAQASQEIREYETGHVPLAETPSTKRLLATMSSLWLVTFFAALDTTIVATLSGPISSSFNSGTSFSWIATGYLIANAACQPLSGKLTDIYGRRAGLIFAFTFFAAGTAVCGFAGTAWVMILGRVIAGMGGGCLNTVSVFVASDLIPLRRRGVWQGIGNVVFGAGMGLGGVFGGFVNDRYGWRYGESLTIV